MRSDAFHMLRSSCRSACRPIPSPARDSRATENTRRSIRPWTRRRRCGGCGGRKGSDPAAARRDPRARVPLVIMEGNPGLRKVTICSEPGVVASRLTPITSANGTRWSAAVEHADHLFSCAAICPDVRKELPWPDSLGPPALRAVVDGDDGAQRDVGAGAAGRLSGGARSAGSCSREGMASFW